MKRYKTIITGLVSLIFYISCNDYLNVNPKTEVTQEALFSTQNGFKDALTGVYIKMKLNKAYGRSLTMTTLEQLISNWDVTSNSTESYIGMFDYHNSTVEAVFDGIFMQQYNTIAQINSILKELEEKEPVFTSKDLYKLIKGECLALRAYCHLDVLRLWGPLPTEEETSDKVLPYVKAVGSKLNEHITVKEFKENILADLTAAEILLKEVDPILHYTLKELGEPSATGRSEFNPSDTYFAYRYVRMNYYAVKALQARAHLWFGNKEDAYAAAKEVVTAKNRDGTFKFNLGTASDMSAGDHSLRNEQVFALYAYTLSDIYSNTFATGTLKKGSDETTVKGQLYGNTGTDIREVHLWSLITQTNGTKTYVLQKYNVPATAASGFDDQNRIPMLRLSEMYLILAETAPQAEAQTYWDSFKAARNIITTTLAEGSKNRQTEISEEYRKEFFAEGQSFYAYKRINASKMNVLWIPTSATINYLIPLPKTETSSN